MQYDGVKTAWEIDPIIEANRISEITIIEERARKHNQDMGKRALAIESLSIPYSGDEASFKLVVEYAPMGSVQDRANLPA